MVVGIKRTSEKNEKVEKKYSGRNLVELEEDTDDMNLSTMLSHLLLTLVSDT